MKKVIIALLLFAAGFICGRISSGGPCTEQNDHVVQQYEINAENIQKGTLICDPKEGGKILLQLELKHKLQQVREDGKKNEVE